MNNQDIFAQRCRELAEAVQRTRREMLTGTNQRDMTKLLGTWWDEQGSRFATQFDAHLHGLSIVTEDDWGWIWNEVTGDTSEMVEEPVEKLISKALLTGGNILLTDLAIGGTFSLKNPGAVDYMLNKGATLITGLDTTSQGEIRRIIADGLDHGDSIQTMARAIEQRFKEFSAPRPQQHVTTRGQLVAATETGNAYETGHYSCALDLKAQGVELEKSWLTAGDDLVSVMCAENEAEGWIGIDFLFKSGHRHPLGHPACRCSSLIRRKR